MEDNLFRYIWRYSKREQLAILIIVLLSFVFFYLSLELPKTIVNEAIGGASFQSTTTVPFLRVVVAMPSFLGGGGIELFSGISLERIPYLVALSLTFLALVIINNGFKRQINTLKGRLGERMLRRLRFDLYDRILRFPLHHFRKTKSAELATLIKDEVEPLGGFIGDAFVTPAFLSGQALTAMVFILVQNTYLGAVAVAVVLIQVIIIPKLRAQLLKLGRERQITARRLAGRIAECADGAIEIHANDTSNYERADISSRLGKIFDIRLAIYQRKFSVKALNNLLAQLPPFVFYLVGGYLVIQHRLDLGALVAVIAAYKDLPSPINELINWDQQRLDVQIKYQQVTEQFRVADMIEPSIQDPNVEAGQPLSGPLTVSDLTVVDEFGKSVLDHISFTVGPRERVAVVGPDGHGKTELAVVLARLAQPTSGRIAVGATDLLKAPEALTGRRLAYVGPNSYLFPLSIRDTLLYGVRHVPTRAAAYSGLECEAQRRREAEARRTGNIALDVGSDWIDYDAVGVNGPEGLNERLLEVLRVVGLEPDLYEFGLNAIVDPIQHPKLVDAVLAARIAVGSRFGLPALSDLVEFFDRDRYNGNVSLGQNLLFGTTVGNDFDMNNLARNPYVREVIDRAGLTKDLLQLGYQIAEIMVELFAGLTDDDDYFRQFSLVDTREMPEISATLKHMKAIGLDKATENDRIRLLSLPFKLIAERHRVVEVDESLRRRVVEARQIFARDLPSQYAGSVIFFDRDRYNPVASLRDNILFGRVVQSQPDAARRVADVIGDVLGALGHLPTVIEAGLDYSVGVAGARLSISQRQKLVIARALLKRPDLLIVNEATSSLDEQTGTHILRQLIDRANEYILIWVLHDAALATEFDRVFSISDGRISDQSPSTMPPRLMAAS